MIEQFYSISDAEKAGQKLRNKGILTHISSKRSYGLSKYLSGAVKVGLWVVLDKQYHDACKVLSGEQVQLNYSLTEEQMLVIEESVRKKSPVIMIQLLLKLLFFLLVLMAIVIYVIYK